MPVIFRPRPLYRRPRRWFHVPSSGGANFPVAVDIGVDASADLSLIVSKFVAVGVDLAATVRMSITKSFTVAVDASAQAIKSALIPISVQASAAVTVLKSVAKAFSLAVAATCEAIASRAFLVLVSIGVAAGVTISLSGFARYISGLLGGGTRTGGANSGGPQSSAGSFGGQNGVTTRGITSISGRSGGGSSIKGS